MFFVDFSNGYSINHNCFFCFDVDEQSALDEKVENIINALNDLKTFLPTKREEDEVQIETTTKGAEDEVQIETTTKGEEDEVQIETTTKSS